MPKKLQIRVLTPSYPTEGEPYRGRPLWLTLEHLTKYADVRAYCAMPDYRFSHRARTYVYSPPSTHVASAFACDTIKYFAIPWVTRLLNGRLIYRRLLERLRGDRPDVLLTYWVYPEGYAAVLIGQELGLPVVVGSRGSDLNVVPKSSILRSKVRSTLSRASAVLCVSSDLGSVARRLGARADRIHVVPNGVDNSVFRFEDQREARARLGLSLHSHLVLYVGRLVAAKGLDRLVEAIAVLAQQPGERWELALAGAGFLERQLRKKATRLGVEGNVRFLGPLKPPQVAEWMNASDLFCLPSESEGCPNVVIEALSCGLPVVATAVGGVPELVDETCAVLLPDNSPGPLAEALARACEKTWDRRAIADGRRRSWDQVAQETYQVCVQVSHSSDARL